ncbi:hypothetical protein FWG95_01125, partial [Candidatus Saccharibacteria bacterium]|nr:hypothetical protein [Candidatus Saccharibacteria bacterium]
VDFFAFGNLLTDQQIAESLKVHIPMRSEEFKYKGKTIVIDGAHNPQKITAFVESFAAKFHDKKVAMVVGFSTNKADDIVKNLTILKKLSDQIVLTTFDESTIEVSWSSGISISDLSASATEAGFSNFSTAEDPARALDVAIETDAEVVAVVGSFYMLNHVRPVLVAETSK